MKQASFRFYAQLNDFLPTDRKHVSFPQAFELTATVKDMIEALGVPHPEVDLVVANGTPVDFSHLVQDGDRISVYPWFHSLQSDPAQRTRPEAPTVIRFVCDTHLGRLAAYLRALGYDTRYRSDYEDDELAHVSAAEERILLTRDRGLLKRSIVAHGYCLRTSNSREQLREVVDRFDLAGRVVPFQRCLHCNAPLRAVPKEAVLHLLPPRTRECYQEFRQCPDCRRVFWRGSHYRRMLGLLNHG